VPIRNPFQMKAIKVARNMKGMMNKAFEPDEESGLM
jgi:hypothetical protein